MKKIKSKIILAIIIIGIAIMALSTSVQARTATSILLDKEYISHENALFNELTHEIFVNGVRYYCGKKGAEYNRNLTYLTTITVNEGYRDFFSSYSSANSDKNNRYNAIESALASLVRPNVVQTMSMTEKNVLTESQKNHIYGVLGVGKYYNASFYTKQEAMWRDLGTTSAGVSAEANNLYDVGVHYMDKWNKETVDLTGSSDDAKVTVKISGLDSKYRMGPFTVKYNEYEKGKYALSWIKEYKFYDKYNNEIKDVRLTNATGDITYKHMNDIPSDSEKGKTFYIEFSYLDNLFIDQVNIDVEVEFISKLKIEDEIKYYEVTKQLWQAGKTKASAGVSPTWITAAVAAVAGGSPPPETWYYSDVEANLSGPTTITPNPMQPLIKGDASVETATEKIKVGVGKYKLPECIPFEPPTIDVKPEEMELAGYAWEDSFVQGKEQETNGSKDEGEKAIPGVLVTLYEVDKSTGARKLATLKSNDDKDPEHKYEREFYTTDLGTASKVPSTNPTITDQKGYYSFKGVDATKKYIIVFTYNGMEYEATTTKNKVTVAQDYNTDKWNKASKGSELTADRNEFNKKFVTIGSTPNNYAVSNKIFQASYLTNESGKQYNEVFRPEELESVKKEIYEAEIDAIKSKMSLNMDDGSYINNVYLKVAGKHGNSTDIYRKLQYINDCKIKSYAGYNSEEGGTTSVKEEYYPVYDKIFLTTNFKDSNGRHVSEKAVANAPKQTTGGYWYVYNGQLNINMGLIPRLTTILNVKEDLYKTVVSLNGKDETYNYGTLSDKELEISASDYLTKTLAAIMKTYNQVIAPEDYNYNTDASELKNGTATYEEDYAKIQVYATYKMVVKNVSAIPTTVNELVTYFDRMYFSYSDSPFGNVYKTTEGKEIASISAFRNTIEPILGVKTSSNSKYGKTSETMDLLGIAAGLATGHDYTDLYIDLGDKGVMLETNDTVTVYITYRMGEDSSKDIKYNCSFGAWHGTDNSAQTIFKNTLGKEQEIKIETITEVNGFSTYYRIDQDTAGKQAKFGGIGAYEYSYLGKQYRAAGVLDTYSKPGNVDLKQLLEVNPTEKDWDKAPTLIFGNANDTRKMSGSVWETDKVANEYIDNSEYPKFDEGKSIEGMTVQLVELKDGVQYVRAETVTEGNGNYTFVSYIPGDYTVRFVYGDKARFDDKQYSKYRTYTMNGETYKYAYNGQFYQSGKANPDTNKNQFWYDQETDTRYSDAYDEANIRQKVNTVFNNETKNGYVYGDVVSLTKHPSDYMVYAYTSLIDIYPEKAKTDTNAIDQQPAYAISNIDFALTPRTETKLSISKEVSNVKLILQNGTVQFDATPETIRNQGVSGVVQAGPGYDINIQMSNELINGSTIEITYKIVVKNDSDYNSVTYYKDSSGNIIGLGLYEENYNSIVYCEENNSLRTYKADENAYKKETYNKEDGSTKYEEFVSYINAGTTELKEYSSTEIIETTTTPVVVADYVSSNLNFSQTDYTGKAINNYWEVSTLTQDEFSAKYHEQNKNEENTYLPKMNNMNPEDVYNVNKIIVATEDNPLISTKLKGKSKDGSREGDTSSTDIILSKVISVENDSTDKKSYNNFIRILQVNNTVSRIQDMNSDNDNIRLRHRTENVIISDPTGEDRSYTIIGITLVVTLIIATGVVLIKKFVIAKR